MVFRAGDRLVGLVPLIIDVLQIGPVKVRVAKPALADFTLALCDPCVNDEFAEEVFQKLLDRVFTTERCDVFATGPLTERFGSLAKYRAAAQSIEGSRFSEATIAPHSTFELPDTFDGYMASLVKKQRGNVRRDESLLERNCTLEADVLKDPELLGEHVDEFLRMHSEQWMREGKLGHFNDWPGASEFARSLVALEAVRGRARLYRLLADGKVVAYQLAFRFGENLHWRMPARAADPEWDRFGLGRVGLVKMIESAIAEGVSLIEGGRGHYDYKIKLGADEAPLQSALITRPGLLPRIRAKALDRWSNVLHFCYYRVWYQRVAPRLPMHRRGLWSGWIRTRL
jgi:CelD/BcsL family acetyltransferase involved in cellulose biosynthesis